MTQSQIAEGYVQSTVILIFHFDFCLFMRVAFAGSYEVQRVDIALNYLFIVYTYE